MPVITLLFFFLRGTDSRRAQFARLVFSFIKSKQTNKQEVAPITTRALGTIPKL